MPVAFAFIALAIAVAGWVVGSPQSPDGAFIFLAIAVSSMLGGLWMRRDYKRYEREAMQTAADELGHREKSTDG